MVDRRHILALAALSGLAPAARGAAPLRIATTHLPPLVLEHTPHKPGALMELVQELCRRMRLTPQAVFVPWPRAVFLATSMPATAIFPLTRVGDREKQFRWLAPLYDEHYVFLAARQGNFDLRHLDDMKTRRIALLRGAGQAAILAEMGFHNLVEAISIDEIHRFLLGGMADASFGERNIIRSSLKSRDEEQRFALSAPLRTTTAWLAGSLDFSEADAQRFQRTMDAIEADGSKRRILLQYGLT